MIGDSERVSESRRRWWPLAVVGGIVVGGVIGLTNAQLPSPSSQTQGSPALPPSAGAILTPAPTSALVFSIGLSQARYVATTMAFFDAFAKGETDAVKAMVTDDVVGGDCDPATDRGRAFRGRGDFEAWLADRDLENDRFIVQRIFNENPDASTGGRVVGVTYALRRSDAITRLGRPNGFTPEGAAKIVFTEDGTRIVALNLGGCGHP